MRIKKIIRQYRRDFTAIYICESCGNEEEGSGYDDAYFHNEVVPKKKCSKCKKTAGANYQPRKTKYAEGVQL